MIINTPPWPYTGATLSAVIHGDIRIAMHVYTTCHACMQVTQQALIHKYLKLSGQVYILPTPK